MALSSPSDSQTVLCVDLDGTLIRDDVSIKSLGLLLQSNPFWIFCVLFWLIRGSAHMRRQIALRVVLDPSTLSYRDDVLEFIREEKNRGRKIVLATASDQKYADQVAQHVGLFDEAVGSEGGISLSSGFKRAALEERYGRYSYVGNSSDDLEVWIGASEIYAVCVSKTILRKLQSVKTPIKIFFNTK